MSSLSRLLTERIVKELQMEINKISIKNFKALYNVDFEPGRVNVFGQLASLTSADKMEK